LIANATPLEQFDQYVDDVLAGRVVAGELIKQACKRHLRDVKRSKTKKFRYRLSEDHINDAVRFFRILEHTTGSYDGEPFELYPWQIFCVGSLLGWVDKKSGFRRFRQGLIEVGRGNGKSPLAAGLGLKLYAADYPVEPRAVAYSVATKRDQAKIIFEETKRFVSRSEPLGKMIRTLQHNLFIPANHSRFEPISSEGKTADGLIPHVVLLDEFHAWQHEHRTLWDRLVTGMSKGGRLQPMLLIVTTAGDDKSDLWLTYYDYATSVVDTRSDIDDDRLFVAIYEIDDKDDELDERVWPKANPMLEHGVVDIEGLRMLAAKAKKDPASKSQFRRFHANKLTTSLNKPITAEMWKKGDQPMPELEGLTCYAGFDWGWKDDLAAMSYVFPLGDVEVERTSEDEDGNVITAMVAAKQYAIQVDAWCPRYGRRDLRQEPLASFIADGWLTPTHSESTDIATIHQSFDAAIERYSILSIAIDQHNCREFATKLENEYALTSVVFAQTPARYNEPLREFLQALQEGRIIHGGNPLLEWSAKNMAIKTNSQGYRMPEKERSSDKIDPIVAVIMALSEAMFATEQTLITDDTPTYI